MINLVIGITGAIIILIGMMLWMISSRVRPRKTKILRYISAAIIAFGMIVHLVGWFAPFQGKSPAQRIMTEQQ